MTEERPDGMVAAMRWELDDLRVPDCDLRRVTLAIAEMVDHPDRGGHLVAALAAIEAIRPITRELYEPKTPLQEQRDYERARRELVVPGYELPPWDETPEDERYGPWNEPSA